MLTWPVIVLLLVMGFFLWSGWYVWAALLFLFGRTHPEPLDDVTKLDLPRKVLAVAMLVIFALIFTPLPMRVVVGEAAIPELDQAANCLGIPALVLGAIVWFMWKMRTRKPIRPSSTFPPQ
jgi:hypothetical protein